MRKFLKFILVEATFGMMLASCSKDSVRFESNYQVSIPVDVNKTKAVFSESAITVADASTAAWELWSFNDESYLKIHDAGYGVTDYTLQPWIDNTDEMIALGKSPAAISTAEGYAPQGTYVVDEEDKTIIATASVSQNRTGEPNNPTDKVNYFYPMPVAFYGIYDAAETVEYGNNGDVYTLAWIGDKKAQYTVAAFAPTFVVGDKDGNIEVRTENGTVSKESRDRYKFTIQYIYIGSPEKVVYGKNYDYTPEGEGMVKVGLPKGGVFAGSTTTTVGAHTDYGFDTFETNKTTYLTLLPNKSATVNVYLCCWNCGTRSFVTENSDGSNTVIKPGMYFYLSGTLKLDANSKVTNATNPDCEEACKNGPLGVFMPDVKTSATINITTLRNSSNDVDPKPGFKTSFTADVVYGDMNAVYEEK